MTFMIFPTSLVNNALLLATLPDLSVPHFLTQVIAGATTHTRNRLVIVLFSRHFNTRLAHSLAFPEIQDISHTKSWDCVQRILTFTYVQATKVAWEANKIRMQVDVLLKGLNEDLNQDLGKGIDIVFRVSGGMSGCVSCPLDLYTRHTFRSNSRPITGIYLFFKTVLFARWWTKSRRTTKYDCRTNSITNRLELTSFLSRHCSRRYFWSPTRRSQDPIVHGSLHHQPEIDSMYNRYVPKIYLYSESYPNWKSRRRTSPAESQQTRSREHWCTNWASKKFLKVLQAIHYPGHYSHRRCIRSNRLGSQYPSSSCEQGNY